MGVATVADLEVAMAEDSVAEVDSEADLEVAMGVEEADLEAGLEVGLEAGSVAEEAAEGGLGGSDGGGLGGGSGGGLGGGFGGGLGGGGARTSRTSTISIAAGTKPVDFGKNQRSLSKRIRYGVVVNSVLS